MKILKSLELKKLKNKTLENIFIQNKFFITITLFFLFLTFSSLHSQEDVKTYRVFFKDKGPEKFEKGSKIFDETLKIITPRAISRRKKVKNDEMPVFYQDAPIYNDYITQIEKTGAKIKSKLRWNNYVVVEASDKTIDRISNFKFVSRIQPTASSLFSLSSKEPLVEIKKSIMNLISTDECFNCGVIEYGKSFQQLNLINVIKLQEMGINGDGVIIGFLDNGYRWKTHNAVKNAKIIAEYDFIKRDSLTANEDGDRPDQDGHGSIVFSTVSGFYNGKLIGVAPCASFLLGKTEDMTGERRVEEDYYAEGIEWLESMGADVISTSLGYFKFDSTEIEYSYSNLDGKSTPSAIAVNKAVSLGVVCVTAAGNSGPSPKTIITPADADSVIAVGASLADGVTPANFTSRGPRVDGVIKPDLSALGNGVYTINPSEPDGFINANGTSMATPLISGSIGLLLSIFPELRPYEIRDLLKKSASQSKNPDPSLGWGIPNIFNAAQNYGIIISPLTTYRVRNFQKVVVFISSKYSIQKAELQIKFKGQNSFQTFTLYPSTNENMFSSDIPLALFGNEAAEAFIIVEDNFQRRSYPYNSKQGVIIHPGVEVIQCGVDYTKLPRFDNNEIFAFVNPSILEKDFNYVNINVILNDYSDVNLKIYNPAGQLIFNNYYNQREPGLAVYQIPVYNFAIGNYFVIVQQKSRTDIVKFVIIG